MEKRIVLFILLCFGLAGSVFGNEIKIQKGNLQKINIPSAKEIRSEITFHGITFRGTNKSYGSEWKLLERINDLPKGIKNSKDIDMDCDSARNLWTANGGGESVLYDRRCNKIVCKNDKRQHWNITPNGKFLLIYDSMLEKSSIRRISDMKEVFPDGFMNYHIIGRGNYAMVEKEEGKKVIVDLRNPSRAIPTDVSMRGGDNEFEAENGRYFFKRDKSMKILYSLPSFQVKKTYSDMGSGIPIMNSDGSVLGSKNGNVVYLINQTTNQSKAYGLSCVDENLLIEVKIGKSQICAVSEGKSIPTGEYVDEYLATKIINLQDMKTVRTVEENDLNLMRILASEHLSSSRNKRNNGLEAVIFPPNSKDIILVFTSLTTHKKSEKMIGDSIFVTIGRNFEVKSAFYYPQPLLGASWDNETNGIVAKTPNGEFVKILRQK